MSNGCDVMVTCPECGRIARYRSMSADEVEDVRACLKDRDAKIKRLEAAAAEAEKKLESVAFVGNIQGKLVLVDEALAALRSTGDSDE